MEESHTTFQLSDGLNLRLSASFSFSTSNVGLSSSSLTSPELVRLEFDIDDRLSPVSSTEQPFSDDVFPYMFATSHKTVQEVNKDGFRRPEHVIDAVRLHLSNVGLPDLAGEWFGMRVVDHVVKKLTDSVCPLDEVLVAAVKIIYEVQVPYSFVLSCLTGLLDMRGEEEEEEAAATRESEEMYERSNYGSLPASIEFIESLEKFLWMDGDDEEEQCMICLDEFVSNRSSVSRMPCSHVFHENCIIEWLRRSNMCPLCRFHESESV